MRRREVWSVQVNVKMAFTRNCSFCSPCRETPQRDRIVIGTHDLEVVQRLLAEKNLPLEFGEPVFVTASATRLGARPPRPDSPWTGRNTPHAGQQCLFCGGPRHAQRRQCPAYNEQCMRCGKMHLFATVSMSKPSPARTRSQTRQNQSPARRGHLCCHRGDSR